MHRTYIEFISTCDVCLIFSLRCTSHLCRHAVYIALVECHIHRIWSLRVLHPPELQSDKCWMQYKLHSGQCDVYLIFKKSNICLISWIALMSHSLSHATYVSSFNCDKHCICFDMPHTSHLWNASSLSFGVSTSYIQVNCKWQKPHVTFDSKFLGHATWPRHPGRGQEQNTSVSLRTFSS